MADRSSHQALCESLGDMYTAVSALAEAQHASTTQTSRDRLYAATRALYQLALLYNAPRICGLIEALESEYGL